LRTFVLHVAQGTCLPKTSTVPKTNLFTLSFYVLDIVHDQT